MVLQEKKKPEKNIDELYKERIELENQINQLNQNKIEKLESMNIELQKKVEWLDKERIKAIKERDNLLRKVRHSNEKSWKTALKMIIILGVIDLVLVPLLITILGIPLQWIFVSIGLITFFGIILVVNYMSGTSPLNTGEIRKALTVSFITVYFALVPLLAFGAVKIPQSGPLMSLVTNFTWIIGAVIIFYFGSRSVEEYIKAKSQF
jgi:hypothetical protein